MERAKLIEEVMVKVRAELRSMQSSAKPQKKQGNKEKPGNIVNTSSDLYSMNLFSAVCWFHRTGKCKRGEECQYSHGM